MRLIFNLKSIAFIVGMLAINNAWAANGTITFTGEVVDVSCTIAIDGESGGNAEIKLDKVGKNDLAKVGATAAQTVFIVKLTQCPKSLDGASLHFSRSSSTVDLKTGNLKNTSASGPATVQFQLLDGQNGDKVINLASSDEEKEGKATVSGNNSSVTLRYLVQYYATAAATPGDVASSVQYDVSYY